MEITNQHTYWTGYCPECGLNREQVKMRLNHYDFYECEKSKLQIAVFPGAQAIIMKTRGLGKFRNTITYGHEIVNGELLSPQTIDRHPFNHEGEVFNELEDLINYLNNLK
ncbi:hypothetical protein [Pedobacter puniceum]|uniref:Uncharacterized protein n=1 Tax=Pedobacter puniceum TaxID=2666136 RepID=A0A7K0FJJ9_9SPHI|nr:hypothetical protein [Pedobacter puniceum]MRX45831.1 hypothetical protein [Pedobacter puniceum]